MGSDNTFGESNFMEPTGEQMPDLLAWVKSHIRRAWREGAGHEPKFESPEYKLRDDWVKSNEPIIIAQIADEVLKETTRLKAENEELRDQQKKTELGLASVIGKLNTEKEALKEQVEKLTKENGRLKVNNYVEWHALIEKHLVEKLDPLRESHRELAESYSKLQVVWGEEKVKVNDLERQLSYYAGQNQTQ